MPTGFNNKGPLDQCRYHLTTRLQRLGANSQLIPGDPKPEWLYGAEPGGYIPPTAVCHRRPRRSANKPVPFLLCGHLDTVHDPAGRVREIRVKQPDPGTEWIWGAFRLAGRTLHALHRLWLERDRQDEYIGTLVNSYLAQGGSAVAVRAGATYMDVGTLHGYRQAMELLHGRGRPAGPGAGAVA